MEPKTRAFSLSLSLSLYERIHLVRTTQLINLITEIPGSRANKARKRTAQWSAGVFGRFSLLSLLVLWA
jgi:hypothetical protein